jgi:hypothetical protein
LELLALFEGFAPRRAAEVTKIIARTQTLKHPKTKDQRPKSKTRSFMPVLSLSNIHKRFGPTIALDGVNLELRRG